MSPRLLNIIALSSLLALLPIALAAQEGALEEIVVTAQKREQSYMEVPLSVATISGEVLELANSDDFQDLVQVSPSVTFSQSGDGRGSGVQIRGIGTQAFQVGVEPTVSTVVDGVVLGRTGSFLSDLVDIERIEILRGPQGTLFGKNASGGVVNVITKRPTEEYEGLLRVSATDDEQQTVQALISGALSDTVRGRLSAYWKDFDGFIDNQFNGQTLNGDQSQGIRAKLDIDLNDRANLLLIADYGEQERNCCVFAVRNVGRIPQFQPFLGRDLSSLSLGEENSTVLLDAPTLSDTEQAGLSAELTVDFDNFVFTSVTGYRYWDLDAKQDIDSMPLSDPTYARLIVSSNDGTLEQDQFSQEFRINSTAWDDVNLTAGLFYWKQDVKRYFQRELKVCGAPMFNPMLPPNTACRFPVTQFGFFNADVDTENAAAFGQVDWRFAPDWTATLGLRYTYDDLQFNFDRPTRPILFPAVPPATFAGGDDDTDVSGKLALQWEVNDSMMTYASYTRGYKSQAFDVIFGMTPDRAAPVAPETSDALELGLKAELFDRRLRIGASIFHTTYENFQGQAFDAGDGAFVLTSAGSIITRGVELDFTAKPTANLLLTGGIALTDAFYDDFRNGPCWTRQTVAQGCIAGVQNLTDKDVPNSPDLKLTLQGRYDFPLDGPLDFYVSGAYRWQDDTNSSVNQRPSLDIDSYGIFDLSVGVESDDGRWSASVFAKNLFDEFYTNVLIETPLDARGGTSHRLTRDYQRYIGVKAEFRFGG